jgi:hypothetical protein
MRRSHRKPALPHLHRSRRDPALLCVVEHPTDILVLEKAGAFHGRYHVLGGKLSPLGGVEPEDLRITELESRLAPGAIREIILALGADVEGDATAYYLAKQLAPTGARITRLAHGLPAGSGLEFADELTLTHALDGRRPPSLTLPSHPGLSYTSPHPQPHNLEGRVTRARDGFAAPQCRTRGSASPQ